MDAVAGNAFDIDLFGVLTDRLGRCLHRLGLERVLDAILEVRPPFDPERAVSECTALLQRFGVPRVVGDRYAGEWPKQRFAEHGIAFEQSAKPKSDLSRGVGSRSPSGVGSSIGYAGCGQAG